MNTPTHISAAGFEMRTGELLQMPQQAFEAYIFRLAEYLLSEDSTGDAVTASSFLQLLTARELREAGSVSQIYDRLLPAISFIAASQPRFDFGENDHGNFGGLAAELARVCGRDPEDLAGQDQMLDPTDDA